jgi:hypothetical protein
MELGAEEFYYHCRCTINNPAQMAYAAEFKGSLVVWPIQRVEWKKYYANSVHKSNQ